MARDCRVRAICSNTRETFFQFYENFVEILCGLFFDESGPVLALGGVLVSVLSALSNSLRKFRLWPFVCFCQETHQELLLRP